MHQQTNPNIAPIFWMEVMRLFGMMLMLGITVLAWSAIGGYWMLWAGISAMVGWSMLVAIRRCLVAKSYQKQNEQWAYEAENQTAGKTTRLLQEGDAIIGTLSGRTGHFIGALGKTLLFYNPWQRGASNISVFAGARFGKTSGSVLGTMLNVVNIVGKEKFSAWVNDPKGEIYFVAAALWGYLGYKIIALNMMGIKGIQKDTYNFCDEVLIAMVRNTGKAFEWADIIAQALIVEKDNQGGSENFVFRENARRLIITFILYLAQFFPFECHLPRVRELVMASDDELVAIGNKMSRSEAMNGLIKTYGNMLLNDLKPANQKLFYSFKVEAAIALKIYDKSTEFGQSSMVSTFSLEDVLDPHNKVILFQNTPQANIGTHGGSITLMSTLIIEKKARIEKPAPFLIVYDEIGNTPQMPRETFKKAITLLPGSTGLRMIMYWQTLAQLKMYGEEMCQLVLDNCSLIQAGGITDPDTAREFSRRAGQTTVKKHSYGKDPKEMHYPWNKRTDEKEEPVLSETEILQLPSKLQLVAMAGQRMMVARVIPFWKVVLWRRLAQPNPYETKGYPETDTVEWEY